MQKVKTIMLVGIALLVGVSFAEGVLSFVSQGSSLIDLVMNQRSQQEHVLDEAFADSAQEQKGSDESVPVLPVAEYSIKGTPQHINADAYLVADVETGEIILSKDAYRMYPIASISKLITALVASEHFTSKQEITVSKSALATYGASGGLRAGETVKAKDLLYPLLLESSNDVALLISEQFKEGEFAELMNDRVAALGMKQTSFVEASGLSAKNVSTAEDIFSLTQYLYNDASDILDITRIREFSLMNHTWNNYNYFLKDSTFVGGKNGYTDEALRTGVALFDLPIRSGTTTDNRIISIVVLHTETREQDTIRLLDFLKKSVSLTQ